MAPKTPKKIIKDTQVKAKIKSLRKVPTEIKKHSQQHMEMVPKKVHHVNHKVDNKAHQYKHKISNHIDTQQLKHDAKVTGFLTMFFTGIGLIVYCVKKHK